MTRLHYLKTEELLGKTITSIEVMRSKEDDGEGEELILTTTDGWTYVYHHPQDCCESVTIKDICGELEWLLNSPLLLASEESKEQEGDSALYEDRSTTWTFYNFATVKGHVTITWFGESNGYYSEEVYLKKKLTGVE